VVRSESRCGELASDCSLPAALEAMGERWAFLILRGSFNGLHHFEEFQSELGIARNILANRLARLVGQGHIRAPAAAPTIAARSNTT
jgi:DNA-binding HxlR family transcriptional regulator